MGNIDVRQLLIFALTCTFLGQNGQKRLQSNCGLNLNTDSSPPDYTKTLPGDEGLRLRELVSIGS